jgi:DNA-binding NtrC family response regulator
VYGIVKQSGGYVWLNSEPGAGTRVQIFLPQISSAVRTEAPRAAPLPSPSGNETILLVEDEEAVRKIAARALTQNGYRVLEAKSGEDALRLSGGFYEPIHLLLTDMVMPGIGGAETARVLKGRRPDLNVLLMSGYTENPAQREAVFSSETPFLQKPFTLENLARKVREVLDGGNLPAQSEDGETGEGQD